MTTSTEPLPVAWGLWNPATGKLDHRCYQREEAARLGAANQSNRWRRLFAVPLFLQASDDFVRLLAEGARDMSNSERLAWKDRAREALKL